MSKSELAKLSPVEETARRWVVESILFPDFSDCRIDAEEALEDYFEGEEPDFTEAELFEAAQRYAGEVIALGIEAADRRRGYRV